MHIETMTRDSSASVERNWIEKGRKQHGDCSLPVMQRIRFRQLVLTGPAAQNTDSQCHLGAGRV